ncbi:hypothetical protein [Piscinibacter sp. XHJ-5]|uniref:hypothetical protein n=1 Tax=Piscinibacter sp. XHJ-5 TaxID=3037797 RepID=UPI0024529F5A|nr:hypothetical protein [Piscinibacter sp. XHJ-5]
MTRDVALVLVMLLGGIAMVGYAIYAAIHGTVHLASRWTNAVINFDKAPIAFSLGVLLYASGGVFFLWIGWGLLTEKKVRR